MINVAILGYGVVGSGVAEVIRKNSKSIAMKAGEEIAVKKILDVRDFPDSPDSELLTKNASEVFDDPSIRIIVETIGGARIAHESIKRVIDVVKPEYLVYEFLTDKLEELDSFMEIQNKVLNL